MVVAVADYGAIGLRGGLPWGRIAEDMAYFKAVTMGHPIIMGAATWRSLPTKYRPLVGRRNMVLSTTMLQGEVEGAEVFGSLNDAILAARDASNEYDHGTEPMIIGGASVYRLALPLVTRIYLTKIPRAVDADTFFYIYDELDNFDAMDVHNGTGADSDVEFTRYDRMRE
jgi:dihydrofolate reductase